MGRLSVILVLGGVLLIALVLATPSAADESKGV